MSQEETGSEEEYEEDENYDEEEDEDHKEASNPLKNVIMEDRKDEIKLDLNEFAKFQTFSKYSQNELFKKDSQETNYKAPIQINKQQIYQQQQYEQQYPNYGRQQIQHNNFKQPQHINQKPFHQFQDQFQRNLQNQQKQQQGPCPPFHNPNQQQQYLYEFQDIRNYNRVERNSIYAVAEDVEKLCNFVNKKLIGDTTMEITSDQQKQHIQITHKNIGKEKYKIQSNDKAFNREEEFNKFLKLKASTQGKRNFNKKDLEEEFQEFLDFKEFKQQKIMSQDKKPINTQSIKLDDLRKPQKQQSQVSPMMQIQQTFNKVEVQKRNTSQEQIKDKVKVTESVKNIKDLYKKHQKLDDEVQKEEVNFQGERKILSNETILQNKFTRSSSVRSVSNLPMHNQNEEIQRAMDILLQKYN